MRYLWITACFFLLLTLSVSSCGSTPQTTDKTVQTIFVAPQKVDCVGTEPRSCLQIRENATDKWEFFYENIKGFEYQEGYRYQLQVRVTEQDNPPADASSLLYTLVKVISKEKVADAVVGSDVESILYEASTRGSILRIKVTPKELALSKAYGVDPSIQDVNTTEWQTLVNEVAALELSTINTLAAPSNDRARDAALAAQVTIINSKGTFVSSIFDHKNPPPALEKIATQLLSMTEGVD